MSATEPGEPAAETREAPSPDAASQPPHPPWPDRRELRRWLLAALALLLFVDLVLAQVLPPTLAPSHAQARAESLRATLKSAVEAGADGRRTILLLGDSVLAGDVLAGAEPQRWPAHRVLEQLRDELAVHAREQVHFEQIALDGLLPSDMLRVVAELDRLDPEGRVELLIEIDQRYFSRHYARHDSHHDADAGADADACSRPSICALPLRPEPGAALAGPRSRGRRLLAWLQAHAPIYRHRARLLGEADLEPAADLIDAPAPTIDDRVGRAREHLRSASITRDHAQVAALTTLLEQARARGRPATGFITPLADLEVAAALPEGALGARYQALAGLFLDRGADLLDLDHPLFSDGLFLDHVHLGAEGSEILAINLLHELGLPLRIRPFEWQIVHPEGHDRSLVHRLDAGYAEGGATMARFDRPEGLAVDPEGRELILADTHNHVLRRLRGNMQFVETVAGVPLQAGSRDGPARADAEQPALLEQPRLPALLDGALWFIDGGERQRLRRLVDGVVETPQWVGPRCADYRLIRAHAGSLWLLCADNRLLWLSADGSRSRELSRTGPRNIHSFDIGGGRLFVADGDDTIWSRELREDDPITGPKFGGWKRLFLNNNDNLLPHGFQVGFPYRFDEIGLSEVVELRWVERYQGLLVADRFALGKPDPQREAALSERVHLRFVDLEHQRVLPWIKPLVHGDAYQLWNEEAEVIASYYHEGSLALVEADASMFWLERGRSRLFRVDDGMLGTAKTGNHHARSLTVPLMQTIWKVSGTVERQLRPDRHLDRRFEPLPRRGPFVALTLGSSLSSMSDRFSNYSFSRRLELELGRELGYRDGARIDLFQISSGAASFATNLDKLDNWMNDSAPPDLIFIEAHDFGNAYLYKSKEEGHYDDRGLSQLFAKLERLAARYDSLVIFYDLSTMEANGREAMRNTSANVRKVLDRAKQLGFVVIEPGEVLFDRLLANAPWGSQPYGPNQHHGSVWAIDLSAAMVAAMAYPVVSEFLRDREPARRAERPASAFAAAETPRDPLRPAVDAVADHLDRRRLPKLDPAYVNSDYAEHELRVYVDLNGVDEAARAQPERVVAGVALDVLAADVYADLAERLHVELLAYERYDEYGVGVRSSASSVWSRDFDRAELEAFLRARADER